MRGTDGMQEALFSFASLEGFVPAEHPLRAVRALVNDALRGLNGLFDAIYAENGRASIAPEKLMRALLLQVFYSVRSERMLMEQIRYNMLFRWFVGLAIDDAVWDHSVFSKNRDRLLAHAVVEAFFGEVMQRADAAALMMLDAMPGARVRTLGADKAYDTVEFVAECRRRNVRAHVAQNQSERRRSAIDGRTTRHPGYACSQVARKRIEEHFGWGKTVGRIRQTVYRGIQRVDQHFKLTMTASNLIRMARMLFAVPQGAMQ